MRMEEIQNTRKSPEISTTAFRSLRDLVIIYDDRNVLMGQCGSPMVRIASLVLRNGEVSLSG